MGLPALSEAPLHLVEHDEEFIHKLFMQHRGMIDSLAYRFFRYNLDRSLEKADYQQEGYLSTIIAASHWDFDRGKAHFGSLLYLYLKKNFHKLVGGKNKLIELTTPEGIVVEIIPYTSYLKKAAYYESRGFTGVPINRIVPLDSIEHRYSDDSYEEEFGIAQVRLPLLSREQTLWLVN